MAANPNNHPQIAGENGAPPVDLYHNWTTEQLNEALEANVGNVVVFTSAPVQNNTVGQFSNYIGVLGKENNIYKVRRSARDSHLTGFQLTHTEMESVVETIPELRFRYRRIVRFTVWAQKCMEERNSQLATLQHQHAVDAEKIASMEHTLETLQAALKQRNGATSTDAILRAIPGEPSTTTMEGWRENILSISSVDSLLKRIDDEYGVPENASERMARDSLRTSLIQAIGVESDDWTQDIGGISVHNNFVNYRILRQLKSKEKQEEALKRVAPKNSDPLGIIISKVATTNTRPQTFANNKRQLKCVHCGKVGHSVANCWSKNKDGAKNARREE